MDTNRQHAMTVDVEDYFHVSAFDSVISPTDWPTLELRVERNTHRLLDLFAQKQAKATFFTLGWVAKRCPQLIQRIVTEGHEVASHGTNHRRATSMSKADLFEDVRVSKQILEDAAGREVVGYRAPSFSINETNVYLYDYLTELGFTYSSSTYPIEHDLYGVPEWPRFAYRRPEGIVEIPIPTIRKGEQNQGIGGGGYFRLFPYWLSKRRIDKFLTTESEPYSFYFHPWEIDPGQPRVKGAPLKSKLRHYINLGVMEDKLSQLLDDYQWSSMQSVYQDVLTQWAAK